MEPQHFNWREACNALVLRRHEMDQAEVHAAKHPSDASLRAVYVAAWQAHHAAENDEFMTRQALC